MRIVHNVHQVHNVHNVFFFSLFLLLSMMSAPAQSEIPFPDALDDAAIRLDKIDDILNNALIIGNGDINALLYSDGSNIILNLTKNDVWDARLITENDPPIPTLNLIKTLGASETAFPMKNNNSSYVLPEGQTWDKKDSYHSNAYPCPRQCARVSLHFFGGTVTRGELDLHRAVATVWHSDASVPPASIRALADRNVFLIESRTALSLKSVESKDIPKADNGMLDDVSWILQKIPGDPDWPGMAFAVAAASSPKSDWQSIAIVTSLESPDPVKAAVALVKETLQEKPEDLIQKHEAEWDRFWSRSGLVLDDPLLQQTWYRSLYFMRCVSKPGVQSTGLFAGLVNDTPAWHGDYHTNYNIQQTYWAVYPANQTDLAEPYDRLMFEYLPRAHWLSQQVFSVDGAYYPHVLYAYEPTDPAACKSRNGRQYIHHVWGMTIGVNGFSVQPLWWRYKYVPDRKRLENLVYPALRDVAIFYAGFVEQCEGDETVRLGPSVSPEHWGWTKKLDRNYNCAFDIAMIRYTLNATIEAAGILGRDADLVERFQKALKRLPDYPTYGDQDPIVVDVEGAPPIEYNISVPATPVFPCDVVTWWSPDKEKELFVRTIDKMKWNGNNATFMLAISRARLSMPGTQEWLREEVEARTRPNATMTLNRMVPRHEFNEFGHYTEQFGAGMAVSELLLQSVNDVIRVFPAIKPGCEARFEDLRTQGGFLVSAASTASKVDSLQIQSLYGGTLRLLSPWSKIEASRDEGKSYQVLEMDSAGIVSIETETRQTWRFRDVP
ncbi:MAG TPA: hypothetical protein PK395_11950 [bacterium]|nr:hypothetical protein [bacterium]